MRRVRFESVFALSVPHNCMKNVHLIRITEQERISYFKRTFFSIYMMVKRTNPPNQHLQIQDNWEIYPSTQPCNNNMPCQTIWSFLHIVWTVVGWRYSSAFHLKINHKTSLHFHTYQRNNPWDLFWMFSAQCTGNLLSQNQSKKQANQKHQTDLDSGYTVNRSGLNAQQHLTMHCSKIWSAKQDFLKRKITHTKIHCTTNVKSKKIQWYLS